MRRRESGVLLHITSLPSPYGIGDLGTEAYRWADFLAGTRQSIWQILPFNPTDQAHGNSPYQCLSAFAGNPLFVSPELLFKGGWLKRTELETVPQFPEARVDYGAVTAFKRGLFESAYGRFQQSVPPYEYDRFCLENGDWLDDYALFKTLHNHFTGKVWTDWPQDIREKNPGTLESLRKDFKDRIQFEKFLQYVFFQQWSSLKSYCNGLGIQIFGDIPIYVIHDSADVWDNPGLFKLDGQKKPYAVAGVPPDYFSETGQLWGNPLYQWDALRETGYAWWIKRVKHNAALFDIIRIDHFRGLIGYWEVQAGERSAVNGRWVVAPAEDFFHELSRRLPNLSIVAEDLGVITPDVREIMSRFEFPGMKVLLFAFGSDLAANPYIPHNLPRHSIIYTGTHDNNTARGWFENEADPETRKRFFKYLGREICRETVHWELIRLAMMSVADRSVFPLQDILGLGAEARMNRPSTTEGNWEWRLSPEQLTPTIAEQLREMTELSGRS